MKFLKLEIHNLASLDREEGEVINFEEGALGESTIFSIVGPTGSGKSTILDAICLALYNRAPRYPRKKGDKDRIEIYGDADADENSRLAPTDGRNILSRGKKIGYSKLTFQANNGDIYRAEWHVHRARVRYGDVVTLLYKIVRTENGWAEENGTWGELPQIIGLDYDQFLRTVLIAQGSFDKFLKAEEKDRYELLEKLVGCEEIYTRITEEIKLKKSASESVYNQINFRFKAYEEDDLTPEQLAELTQQIKELEDAEQKLAQELEMVKKALDWYVSEEKLLANITKYKVSLDAALLALENMKERAERLALHDATLPAVDLFRELKLKDESMQQIAKELTKLSADAEQREKAIATEEEKLKGLVKDAEEAAQVLSEKKPRINEARTVKAEWKSATVNACSKDEVCAKAGKDLDMARKASDDNIKAVNNYQSELNKAQTELEGCKVAVDEQKKLLNIKLEEAAHTYELKRKQLEAKKMEELLLAKDQATASLQDLKEAISVQHEWKKRELQKLQEEQENEKLATRIGEIEKDLSGLNIESLAKELETDRKIYILLTSENWNMHRQFLVEGEPCPLCGAKHHPYQSVEEFEPVVTDLASRIGVKQAELNKQTNRAKDLNTALGEKKGKLEVSQKLLANLDTEISDYRLKWTQIQEKHLDWTANEDSLKALLQPMEEVFTKAQQELDGYNELYREVEKLRVQKEQEENKLKKYEADSDKKLKGLETRMMNVDKALASEMGKTENLKHQREEKEEALKTAFEEKGKAQELVNQKLKELKDLIGEEDPDVLERKLTKAKDDAEKEVENKNKWIAELKQQLANVKGNIQSRENQQKQDQETKEAKEQQLSAWLSDYNADESHVRQLALEDIIGMFEATDNWEAIRKEKETKVHIHTSAKTTYENEVQAHLEHQQSKPSEEKETLLVKKQELVTKDNSELTNAKNKLQRYQTAKKAMGDMYEQKQKAEQIKNDWEAIMVAVGGADGKMLRKIAQCYTLHFLVEHANAEIRKFNQRYELVQVKNSLGIRVIDHDRADDVRDVTSLSGGETFIVSLGLALGLSSLSSRSISFGNLFIDEGFGTLDPDTLATVIDSLAMLQTSQGKKVGVISHTDTMSERITTQIRVIKNGNTGSSRIEVYP